MVFRDQQLEPNELRELVRHFGPLFHHHADEGVHYVPDIPEVLEIRKEPNDERLFGGGCWHADVTFRKPAGYVSVLHAQIIPTLGGDTVFSSTIAAFNGLSGGMQSLLRKLDAVHSYDGPGKPDHKTQCATHPVVRQHPCTNSEGIYLNKMFATRFDGMTAEESRPLIEFLDRHMCRPEYTCRVRWRGGQVVMWDNRFSLHYPINDFQGQRRSLLRCTALEA